MVTTYNELAVQFHSTIAPRQRWAHVEGDALNWVTSTYPLCLVYAMYTQSSISPAYGQLRIMMVFRILHQIKSDLLTRRTDLFLKHKLME
jgi:hypothetical protein